MTGRVGLRVPLRVAGSWPGGEDVRVAVPRRFSVQIEGVRVGRFEEVDNLSASTEVMEIRDGGDRIMRQVPGRIRYGRVTLRRGDVTRALWRWWAEVKKGDVRRRTVTISLVDSNDEGIAGWRLTGCWPSDWRMSASQGAKPSGLGIAMEEITFVVEDIELT